MKNQKGITLITLIIIIAIVVIGIIFIVSKNQGDSRAQIEWGNKPSNEYYELLTVVFDNKLLNKESTFSSTSFNTLGKDVKKAKGKWFKNSNASFKAKVTYDGTDELLSITDGEHVAVFCYHEGNSIVNYYFLNKKDIEIFNLADFNLFDGYRITIK